MRTVGDNFVTLGHNIGFSEYWGFSSVADYSKNGCRLLSIWWRVKNTKKFSSRTQRNF